MSLALGAPPRGTPPGADETVTLTVGGQAVTGWQRVQIIRPLCAIPASFDLTVTERYPNLPDIDIRPGDPCTVAIGGELVITGYVDRYAAILAAGMHSITVSGRSKSQDLVDCSALVQNTSAGSPITPGMQILQGTSISIAEKLAAPYGVPIKSTAGDGRDIPQFNINLGETAWEIIDRVTRYSKMLCYDLPDGTLLFCNLGTEVMASGVAIGENVESASVALSMDQRFSEYEGHILTVVGLGTDAGMNTPGVGEIVYDKDVPRFRKRYVISEQFVDGRFIAHDRAVWECNRRKGQGSVLTATIDAWRDASGALWEPNKLVPMQAKALKLPVANWIIGRAIFTRDEHGQHATLEIMNPIAFTPEPTAPGWLLLNQDVDRFNPTKPNVPPAPDPRFP